MIGYICKYTPIEIFEAMGEKTCRIEPDVTNFNQADTLMHPNLCSYAKGVVETVLDGQYDGIILTTCCDSIRRAYDVLKQRLPETFVYLLDVPRIAKDAGIDLYETKIREMISAYEIFSGKTFDEQALANILQTRESCREDGIPKQGSREKNGAETIRIGILGARANANIKRILDEHHAEAVFDFTCTGVARKLLLEKENVLHGYVRGLISQFPCMRMEEAANREQMIGQYLGMADGIIYHTVQFCDNYSYEYAWLKEHLPTPLLLLETDYTKQSYGQILTRMEAFLESLAAASGRHTERVEKRQRKAEDGKMYVLGVDSGSTSTNAVIMDQDRKITAFSVVRTGAKSGESAERILEDVLGKAGLKRENLAWIVSTGYGRVSIPFADETVTEISCHGKGAHYFNPHIRTILDIGGQDSKAIKLDGKGEVIDFVMNDKCAAGTGRFLEAIARTLEVGIDELGPIALQSREKITITSMCTVFAESEVISLIANNTEKADIADGICHAIAAKAFSLLKRVGPEEEFMMTGGVAKNPGVVHAVEEKLQSKLYICPEPEIVGAAGAALYALDKMKP